MGKNEYDARPTSFASKCFIATVISLGLLFIAIVIALILLVFLRPTSGNEVHPDGHGCPKDINFAAAGCECLDKVIERENKSTLREARVKCDKVSDMSALTTLLRQSRHRSFDVIQIDNTDLGHLPGNFFYEIDVSDVQLHNTPISSFAQGKAGGFLGIQKTLKSLAMIQCRLNESQPFDLLTSMTYLEFLDLSFNEIRRFKKEWWSNYVPCRLVTLNLRANGLEKIEAGSFQHLDNLRHLDISENKLVHLSGDLLPPFSAPLIILDARYNYIKSIHCDTFVNRTALSYVHLDYNHLSGLSPDVWVPIFNRVLDTTIIRENDRFHVELFANPIMCDCEFQWITRYSWNIRDDAYFGGTCKGPPNVAGRRLSDVRCDEIDGPCLHFMCNDQHPWGKGGCPPGNGTRQAVAAKRDFT